MVQGSSCFPRPLLEEKWFPRVQWEGDFGVGPGPRREAGGERPWMGGARRGPGSEKPVSNS